MRRNNGNAVGSLHLSQGPPHGGLEVIGRAKMFFNQVHKNFGVRCGRETMASTFEDRPEGSMIFNNTVVDEGYPPHAIDCPQRPRFRPNRIRDIRDGAALQGESALLPWFQDILRCRTFDHLIIEAVIYGLPGGAGKLEPGGGGSW